MVYNNVPGVRVEVRDGGLSLTAPAPGTKVTLLGITTSANLTINQPTIFQSKTEALDMARNSDATPSELSFKIEETFNGGATLVEVVKLADSSGDITLAERYTALETAYTYLLDSPTDIVIPVGVYIDKPADPSGDPELDFGVQLAQFCYNSTKLNDTTIGVIGARSPMQYASDMGTVTSEQISTWDTEENAVKFATPTLEQVDAWVTHMSNFDGFEYFDGSGITGITPIDPKGRPTSYKYWATDSGVPGTIPDAVYDSNGWPIDQGAYISVLTAPLRVSNSLGRRQYAKYGGFYSTDGRCGYAGYLTTLKSESATTNKKLPSGLTSQVKLSLRQVDSLIGARFVTVQRKVRGDVWARGVTAAWNVDQYNRSDFVNLTTVRTVHEVADVIRNESDEFIGEPISASNLAALEQRIDVAFATLVDRGALRSYDFSVQVSESQRVLGECTINVSLQIPGELNRVWTSIGLTK